MEQPEFFLESPSDESVTAALNYYGIKYPEVVLSQAKLETGNYRSRVCKECNNLFGLYDSKNKCYFEFDHWTESVEAYGSMIQYKMKKDEDYFSFLDRIGYAEDPEYLVKIKQIMISL